MSTLHSGTIKKNKRRKMIGYVVGIVLLLGLSPLIVEALNGFLNGTIKDFGNFQFDFNYVSCVKLLIAEKVRRILLLAFMLLFSCFYVLSCTNATPNLSQTATKEVASGIRTPVAVGNGQFGTGRFMTKQEIINRFEKFQYTGNSKKMDTLPNNVGTIVDFIKEKGKEIILYVIEPLHTIIIGSTRSGKTRRLFLTSIWLNILAGVNMCITDCKGEIWAYTHKFAEKHDYHTITFDLSEPNKSMHYNFLTDIVEELKCGNVPQAIDKTWDLVSILVGEAKGEKLWHNGECATIAATILIVAKDAPEGCKNLTNVYYFLGYMCESNEFGEMPINAYLQNLPDSHPAKGAFQQAKIASSRSRASFFTSALATLLHFTNYNIADMTSCSDYSFKDIDKQKTIIYLKVPDEKTTLYGLGSLYINQLYVALVDLTKKQGGSLTRKFVFKLDEFGNFPVIPSMNAMMSAGAGRNIFFDLVIQDYQQVKSKYKETYGNIKANAQLTIYLKTTEDETLKELSRRCDNYTVQVNSSSTSQNDGRNNNVSYSASANMASRPLLYPGEIGRIKKPDALLLLSGEFPAIVNLPDISEYYANEDFGMGNEEFNKKLIEQRNAEVKAREVVEPYLWGIWNQIVSAEPEEEKVSFMN